MSDTEVFSPNKSIDESIRFMLPAFDQTSQRRMMKAIRDAGRAAQKQQDENTDASARHIFREFIPAFVLNRCGFTLEYEHPLDGTTPDWFDQPRRLIVENLTFERGGTSPFLSRVRAATTKKCDKYADVITNHSLSIVVAVYLDFITCVDLEDCYEDRASFQPIFDAHPNLRGILFFTEDNDGIRLPRTPYGFICLTNGRSFENETNWQVPTFDVRA